MKKLLTETYVQSWTNIAVCHQHIDCWYLMQKLSITLPTGNT